MSLTRERFNTSIDRIHNSLLNINTDNLMTHASELNCQRQPDLPERNDGDLHEQILPDGECGAMPQVILPTG